MLSSIVSREREIVSMTINLARSLAQRTLKGLRSKSIADLMKHFNTGNSFKNCPLGMTTCFVKFAFERYIGLS